VAHEVPASDDAVRAALRAGWQRVPERIRPVAAPPARTWSAQAWTVDFDGEHHLVTRVPAQRRPQADAAAAAILHLTDAGLDAATPMRTLGGALTAVIGGDAYAVVRALPGRGFDGADPLDQQWWGDLLGRVHRALDGFTHAGLVRWHWVRPDAPHLDAEPWVRPAVAGAVAALTRLSVTDRLTYGVLHGDPMPGAFRLDPLTGRTGLVSWGYPAAGPLVFDVAAAVAHAGGPAAAGELLDGYAAAGPVPREELDAALPVLLRFHWAARVDWHARAGDRDALAACRAPLEAAT
jgi:Ser/Thr protein kinase RdoA (MazF antagonist)